MAFLGFFLKKAKKTPNPVFFRNVFLLADNTATRFLTDRDSNPGWDPKVGTWTFQGYVRNQLDSLAADINFFPYLALRKFWKNFQIKGDGGVFFFQLRTALSAVQGTDENGHLVCRLLPNLFSDLLAGI